MDWTAGYASDVEYVSGFYREQSPHWLNLVCLLNGIAPVDITESFHYCELGCGRGLTAQILAAGNPQGQFYAADFNPSHVAGARALAAEAQLSNLTLLENSFEELALGDVPLPQFDFITLHGIYTWITEDNQGHIVRFIKRYLKPGGLVYVSYNAQPGWSAVMPLQRLLIEHADLFPSRSDIQIKAATEFINLLEANQAGYIVQNPGLSARLNNLRTANPNYLVHEYMHRHWKPLFHADVARHMSAAKLSYAGSADLTMTYPALCLDDARLKQLKQITAPETQETVKDFFLNTAFRKDVFVRGPRRLTALRQAELLQQMAIVLSVPRDQATNKLKLSIGELVGREDLYSAVIDAIAEGPRTIQALAQLPALAGQGIQSIAQIAALLCASGQAEFFFISNTAASVEPAKIMNRTLATQTRYEDDHAALCSPLTGSGIVANYVERLFYLSAAENSEMPVPATLARFAWQAMVESGRYFHSGERIFQSEKENLTELTVRAEAFIMKILPIWQTLKVI